MKEKQSQKPHIILGTGPVGSWIAVALRELNIPVRAVNRTGKLPDLMPVDVEIIKADISNIVEARDVTKGAAVIYQALNPRYHEWHKYFPGLQAGALSAAKTHGAKYVSIENLYMYDSSAPITEDSPIMPRSKKGELRARMADEVMEAHAKGEIKAAALRSSDYYGPGVLGSALGEMVFSNLVLNKKAQVSGSASLPHSFAYIEDVGRAAVTLGTKEEALGKIWIAPHAPACTQKYMVEKACSLLGIKTKFSVISALMMRVAGLFIPEAKASVEMMYEFTEPFEVDSARIQKAFKLEPTPIETGIEQTVEWYKKRLNK